MLTKPPPTLFPSFCITASQKGRPSAWFKARQEKDEEKASLSSSTLPLAFETLKQHLLVVLEGDVGCTHVTQ